MGNFVKPDGKFDLSSFLTAPPTPSIETGKTPDRIEAEQQVAQQLPDPSAQALQNIQQSQMPLQTELDRIQAPTGVDDFGIGQVGMSWGRQFARGLYRGVGTVVESLGDATVFAQAVVAPNTLKATANKPARWLREKGEGIREANQIYIPKELEEFEWKDLVNPTFWSTKVAEQIPFVFSMFVPYVGGSMAATRGLSYVGRYSRFADDAKKIMKRTGAVADKGKGIGGMLFRQVEGKAGKPIGKIGLNPAVEKIVGISGGGIFANFSEGAVVAGCGVSG